MLPGPSGGASGTLSAIADEGSTDTVTPVQVVTEPERRRASRIPRATTRIAIETFQAEKPLKVTTGLYEIR